MPALRTGGGLLLWLRRAYFLVLLAESRNPRFAYAAGTYFLHWQKVGKDQPKGLPPFGIPLSTKRVAVAPLAPSMWPDGGPVGRQAEIPCKMGPYMF